MIRKLSKIDWRYALGEVFLIFLGINLALWFNNLNENRKTRSQEIETLKEIKLGLQADLIDIVTNIEGFENRTKSYDLLIKYLINKKPMDDSLRMYLPFLSGSTMFVTNRTPYETLKSHGFWLISNDSLRAAIMKYYDVSQDWMLINEDGYLQHYTMNIKPILVKHFEFRKGLLPFDFDALCQDREVLQNLLWANSLNYLQLNLYKDIRTEANTLIQKIDKELAR
ncbi:MAG: hypothetical protein SFU99_19180 [Saprospiraceae bacterium]|nr:hypothetical protein [Saprospiraceae bacterium]